MKKITIALAVGLITFYSQAQKEKLNLTLYSDAEVTTPIKKLNIGQTVFYALVELNEKDFKKPFGKLFGYTNINGLETFVTAKKLSDGINKKDVIVYEKMELLPKTFGEILASDGRMIIKIDLSEHVNFYNSVEKTAKYGKKVYPLHVRVGFSSNPIAQGIIEWDLTDGGSAYAAANLASKSDYTFPYSDGVNDPAYKELVKKDIESRLKVKIYQMAHGERVPYTKDLRHYRRNLITITFKDLGDGNCYIGRISAFDEGATREGPPFKYDMQGRINYGDQIPCDRVDK